jgi:predicted RNase H-like HicB family nuclease
MTKYTRSTRGQPEHVTEPLKYLVLFRRTKTGYSAHVRDLPGCVAAAATLEVTRHLIREAIEFHIEGMRLHGEAVPDTPKLIP